MSASPTDRGLLEQVADGLVSLEAEGTVGRWTVGDRLLSVTVQGPAGAQVGVAHRPTGTIPESVPTDATQLARWAVDPPSDGDAAVERALGIASLNARSAPFIEWRRGDPMAALAGDVDRIATVGLFRAAFRKFDAVEVRVVEREPVGGVEAPPGVTVRTFTPAEREAAFAGVDVLFVTGSSLVYGGTTDYLQAAADVPTVVLIGATASFLPDPAFAAGATMVAGVAVADAERVRTGIEAGQCGTDLHGDGLEKGYVTAGPAPAGLDLGVDSHSTRAADR